MSREESENEHEADKGGYSGVGSGEVGAAAKDLPKFAERPTWEPPRRRRGHARIWSMCEHCGMWSEADRASLRRFCDSSCAAAHVRATGLMRGENNPRWLGGVSRDNMRYRNRQKARWPEREAARRAVGAAVRSGRLVRQACEACGDSTGHAHHDDYSKPLDVRWLCRRCHDAHHRSR